jgi:dephospho-CoA kinase
MIIGVIGRMGAGKDEACSYLAARCRLPVLSTGEIARNAARARGRPETRAVLHEISRELLNRHGTSYFIDRLIASLEWKALAAALINGVRSPADVDALDTAFGPGFLLLHVSVADPNLRYRRLQERGEPRDPMTFDTFLDQDESAERIFHLQEAIGRADLTVDNGGTVDSLRRQLEEIVIRGALAGRLPCSGEAAEDAATTSTAEVDHG